MAYKLYCSGAQNALPHAKDIFCFHIEKNRVYLPQCLPKIQINQICYEIIIT